MTEEELAALRQANREALAALAHAGVRIDDAQLRTHCLLEFLIGTDRMPAAEEYFERSLEDTVAQARKQLARAKLRGLA